MSRKFLLTGTVALMLLGAVPAFAATNNTPTQHQAQMNNREQPPEPPKDAKAIIDALLSTVTEEVKNDSEIRLIGFGTFKKAKRAARKGRNPQTGAEIEIAASESLSFKSSVKY